MKDMQNPMGRVHYRIRSVRGDIIKGMNIPMRVKILNIMLSCAIAAIRSSSLVF